jgi:hypothetical protein
MATRRKKKQPDHQQLARRILDTLVPDAEPKKKGTSSKKRPSR